MTTIRVLLADDHGVLRDGLRALINDQLDMNVVGEAASADEVLALAATTEADVAVVDIRMPGNGLEAAARLRARHPTVRLLMLTQHDDPAYLRQARAAGAAGYLLKTAAGAAVLEAIRTVAHGSVYVDPAMARALVENAWQPATATASPDEVLSERERQVLRLVALGHTSQSIADQLALSTRTVETYKVRCMEKLGLKGRAALVTYALQHGLLGHQDDTTA